MKKAILFLSLSLLLSGCITEDVIRINTISHTREYVNATTINGSGFTSDSGNNTNLINQMNEGNWQGNESNAIPWTIYITFYNVTHFDAVTSIHKYNSSSGTPSSHIVTRFIWCTIHNDWMALEEFTNEDKWFDHTKRIEDSSHFIYPNGTVIIKYEHLANGNVQHDIWIDVCRLVSYENVVN